MLDEKCWFNYYQPLLENAEEFLKKYDYADEVKEFIEECEIEADMYNRFKDYYSYVFYIAKKKAVYQTAKTSIVQEIMKRAWQTKNEPSLGRKFCGNRKSETIF